MPTGEKHSTFVCLFNSSSGIFLQSTAVSAELWKAFRGQEKLGQEEKKGTKSTRYKASDQLPQAFSCIILTLQCVEQDILLSSTKNRVTSDTEQSKITDLSLESFKQQVPNSTQN